MPKKLTIAIIVFVFCLPVLALGNGFNLNGLCSRAAAMGGAFVGVADDFSAVFWNPAGAAGFRRTTFGFHATDLMPKATYHWRSAIPEYPDIDAKTKLAHYLGWLAAFYRPVGPRVVVGLGLGTPSGLGASWDGRDFMDATFGDIYSWSSKVGVISISPLVAVKLSDAVSVGATFNLNYGMFNLKTPTGLFYIDGGLADLGQYEENMNGWGVGATLGLLITPSEKFRAGLTVRTPSKVALNGSSLMTLAPLQGLQGSSDLKRRITWPLWVAGGVSFRPAPRLLLSADVHWTQWSKLARLTTEYLDAVWAPLMEDNNKDVRVLNWKDKAQFRFGAEYALNATTALRAGYYFDPAPGPASTLNVFLPSHTYNALTLGFGKTVGDLRLDFGLEYLTGNKRTADFEDVPPPGAMSGTYGMKIIVPAVSVSYTF